MPNDGLYGNTIRYIIRCVYEKSKKFKYWFDILESKYTHTCNARVRFIFFIKQIAFSF